MGWYFTVCLKPSDDTFIILLMLHGNPMLLCCTCNSTKYQTMVLSYQTLTIHNLSHHITSHHVTSHYITHHTASLYNASHPINPAIANPWAHYRMPGLTFNGSQWNDSSTHLRHLTNIFGSPATSNSTFYFNTTQGMVFPTGSIPTNFTIFVVARYTPNGQAHKQITNAQEGGWYLGWHNNTEQAAYYGQTLQTGTLFNATAATFKYHIVVGRNQPGHTSLFWDGAVAASNMSGSGGKTLAINSAIGTASDCEVQEVIIFRDFMVDEDVNMWVTQNIGECVCACVCV